MEMYGLLLGALLGIAAPAYAITVYKSVDANGKVSFSDQPPGAGIRAETIEIGDYTVPDSVDTDARLRAMRETTDRLRDDRRARTATQPATVAPPYVVYQPAPQRIENTPRPTGAGLRPLPLPPAPPAIVRGHR
jgi:hypothetical protein